MKLLDQIMLLPDSEKIILVNQIIDSIADETTNYSIPDDVKQLVQERVARYNANPSSGLSLNEFKTQFKEKISKLK